MELRFLIYFWLSVCQGRIPGGKKIFQGDGGQKFGRGRQKKKNKRQDCNLYWLQSSL